MRQAVGVIVLGVVLAVSAPAVAGPGNPLGGDDAGCQPADSAHAKCAGTIGKAFAKTARSGVACHVKQASAAAKGTTYDQAACTARLRTKFDTVVGKLVALHICPPYTAARAAVLVDRVLGPAPEPFALATVNGLFYCDATSGVPIDPGGDVLGFVPTLGAVDKCEGKFAKNIAKLVSDQVVRCHVRFGTKGLDDEECETSLLEKSHKVSLKLAPTCPPCLDLVAQDTVASAMMAFVDQTNGLVFTCPAPAPAQQLFLRFSAAPVAVPGGSTSFYLDGTAPVAATATVATLQLTTGESGALPTFTAPAFAATTELAPNVVVTLDLSANHTIKRCADVELTLSRIDPGGAATPIGTGAVRSATLPASKQGGAVGFAEIEVAILLGADRTIAAGESVALSATVTNVCSSNRGVRLAYDGTGAQSRADLFPAGFFPPFN